MIRSPGGELAQGVPQQSGFVEEVPGGGVPALFDQLRGGGVEQVPQGGDGGLDQVGVAVGVPGEQPQPGLDDVLLHGPKGHGGLSDALGTDLPAQQGQPPPEHDRCPGLRLTRVQVLPALRQGPERERVDPGGQPGPDPERLHPHNGAKGFVLVLGVSQDQGAVPEVHHPQDERLGGGGLATAGFAEADDVGIADRAVAAQASPERVGVECPAGQHVDAHLGAGGWQAGGGDERPQHGCLVASHPPH